MLQRSFKFATMPMVYIQVRQFTLIYIVAISDLYSFLTYIKKTKLTDFMKETYLKL